MASAVQDDPDRRGGRGAPLGALCRRLAAPLLAPGWRGRACAFGSIVLVTLINPNHVHALLYPFQLAGRREFTDIIVELRSLLHPDYHGALFVWAFAAAAAVIVVFAALARRRVVPALLIPTVVFGLLGVRFLRGVGEFAPLVPAFLAAHGAWLGRGRRLVPTAALAVIGLTLACAAGVLWRGIPMGAAPPLRIGLGVDGRTVPAGAVRFIAEAPVPGRVFNFMSFGSYMIHELWPGKQVYIDGRLEVFPEGFLRDYRRMQDTGAGWDEAVARYGIAAAIVPYEEGPATSGGGGTAGDASGGAAGGAKGGATGGAAGGATGGLLARLRTDPDWSCVYFGEIAIVYARHVPETAELLRRFGSRFDPNLRSIESVDAFVASASPEDLAQAVSALGEMTRITPDELAPAMALGLLLDGAGRPEEAVEAFRQVVRLQPRSLQPRLQIAGALARAGQFDLARREAEEAERCAPRSAEPFLLLAEIERTQGRLPAAAAALERALALDARNYLIPLRLGALNGQMGRLDLAREYLNRAARLKPGDPAVIQNLEMLRRAESGQRGN